MGYPCQTDGGNPCKEGWSTPLVGKDGGTPWLGRMGYPSCQQGWGTPWLGRMRVPPRWEGWGIPLVSWMGVTPSPPAGVNKLKILPSIILWMRAVIKSRKCSSVLGVQIPNNIVKNCHIAWTNSDQLNKMTILQMR